MHDLGRRERCYRDRLAIPVAVTSFASTEGPRSPRNDDGSATAAQWAVSGRALRGGWPRSLPDEPRLRVSLMHPHEVESCLLRKLTVQLSIADVEVSIRLELDAYLVEPML